MGKQRFYHRSKDKSNGVDFDTPSLVSIHFVTQPKPQPKGLFLF